MQLTWQDLLEFLETTAWVSNFVLGMVLLALLAG